MDNRLLLIDDEEDIRTVLAVSLEDLGFQVDTAENGEAGLRIFRATNPPIIITDIKMPDIDGLTLLRRIKHENPDAEVIMITGHGDMEAAIESLQQEAADFITKPIDIDSLENALNRVREKITTRGKLRDYMQNLEGLVFEKSIRLNEVEQVVSEDYIPDELGVFQNRFRKIFNETPCYMTVHDRDLRLTAANRRFNDTFGLHIGEPCYQVFKQREEPCEVCPVQKVFDTGESCQGSGKMTTLDGRSFETLLWVAPVTDPSGKATHAAVMAVETSDILEVQEHLSMLGLMLASVSHSIKGMLTGLDGGLYLLESGVEKDRREQTREGLAVVRHTAGRIRKMVLDILLFAKEREIRATPASLPDLCADIARTIALKAREAGVRFTADIDENAGHCNLDAGFMRTALINVLENAIEACDGKPDGAVLFRLLRQPEHAVFLVKDNGLGMDEETRDRMFDLFYSKKGRKGTGLGMYIAQRIVRQHGGDIDVRSEPGVGTAIEVHIPLDLESDPADSEDKQGVGGPARGGGLARAFTKTAP